MVRFGGNHTPPPFRRAPRKPEAKRGAPSVKVRTAEPPPAPSMVFRKGKPTLQKRGRGGSAGASAAIPSPPRLRLVWGNVHGPPDSPGGQCLLLRPLPHGGMAGKAQGGGPAPPLVGGL